MTTRRGFLRLLGSGAAATACSGWGQTAARERKPNLLLIFVDDLGYGDPGCYGGTQIPTPNIDALARDGVRFTDGYVTCSVCGPSRLGLLSGAYQQRFGCYWNDDLWAKFGLQLPARQALLPQALKRAGYVTGHVGKWNITEEAKPYVDEAYEVMNWKGAYYPEEDGIYLGVNGPGFRMEPHGWGPPRPGVEYLTDRLTRRAVEFVERHAEEPFFLYLAYNAPHTPLQADRRFAERFAHLADEPNRLYAGMVTELDKGIGQVLAKLRDLGLEEDTLVAFVSDNGPAKGSSYLRGWQDTWPTHTLLGSAGPLNGHKARNYEGGIRVPFLLRWPGRLPAGATISMPVISLDLYPTFCAAAGVTVPEGTVLDGIDLLSHLQEGDAPAPVRTLFWKTHNGGAARRGDWKIVIGSKGRTELYNLAEDVGERADRADREPGKLRELRTAWEAWGAPFPRSAKTVWQEKNPRPKK